jgi:hypothetical protein
VKKAIADDMFANRVDPTQSECRLADELKHIKKNEVHVIDVAKLAEDKQAFVFGDALKTLYNLKLGEYDNEDEVNPPSRIVIFIDELNKYASNDVPKSSPFSGRYLMLPNVVVRLVSFYLQRSSLGLQFINVLPVTVQRTHTAEPMQLKLQRVIIRASPKRIAIC